MSGFGRRAAGAAVPLDRQRVRPLSLAEARALVQPAVARALDPADAAARPRGELAATVATLIRREAAAAGRTVDERVERTLVTEFVQKLIGAGAALARADRAGAPPGSAAEAALPRVMPVVLERIDTAAASAMSRGELGRRLRDLVATILPDLGIVLNTAEQRSLVTLLIDDMRGLGPLEPLLADDSVSDVMANGVDSIWVERRGRLERTTASFRDVGHMMAVVTRIVTAVGRRIDESSPLVDARLPDGSRVNIIIPPLALDGPAISIRKFARHGFDLDRLVAGGSLSEPMAELLAVATRCRLNILVSGGTGSGKTTLLNALSRAISADERIVTIEDAAELQLGQPHVVRLETRPPSLEGRGEVTMRDLLKNALRMRPDRIILGEVRGAEALDMLQAMNTGHDGSLGTIHANRPREALSRLETMVAMAGYGFSGAMVRQQIASALQLIVQVARQKDGSRRVVSITEVTGIEGDVITMHELFAWRAEGTAADGRNLGRFVAGGVMPAFQPRAAAAGLGERLAAALGH